MTPAYAACPVHRSAVPSTCEVRGFCGPFVGQDRYSACPDPAWHGFAECAECGNTVSIRVHEARRVNLLTLYGS